MSLSMTPMLILNGMSTDKRKKSQEKLTNNDPSFSITFFFFFSLRNDILRQHGIIPQKPPSPTPVIEEAILEAREREHENRLEDKDLDELDALEDEEDEEFLAKYR